MDTMRTTRADRATVNGPAARSDWRQMLAGASHLRMSYPGDTAVIGTRGRWLFAVIGTVVLLLFPLFASNFVLSVFTLIGFASVGALALNLLIGVTGQISIGSAAFLAVGGFSAAFFAIDLGLPLLVLLPLVAIISGLIGIIVGLPALRLRGLYLLMATLAMHYIVIYIANLYQSNSAGPAGFLLPIPEPLGIRIASPTSWYYVAIGFAALGGFIVTNLLRSRFGRAWLSIHHRDIAAEIIGIHVPRMKLLVFVWSSVLIGLQGVLSAYYLRVLDRESFTLDLAIQYIAMIVIGGMASVLGSYLGAVFVIGFPFLLTSLFGALPENFPFSGFVQHEIFEIQVAVYGAAIAATLLFEPQGLAGIWSRIGARVRRWPFKTEIEVYRES